MAFIGQYLSLILFKQIEPLIVQSVDGNSINGQLVHSVSLFVHGLLVAEMSFNRRCLRHKLIILASFDRHVKNKVLRRRVIYETTILPNQVIVAFDVWVVRLHFLRCAICRVFQEPVRYIKVLVA